MKKKDRRYEGHIRYFLPDGKTVPGGSTIANYGPQPALIRWAWLQGRENIPLDAARDVAASIGTATHEMIHCHLQGIEFDSSTFPAVDLDLAKMGFQAFLEWQQTYHVDPILIEQAMVNVKERYGGTIDLYAKVNDKLCLIDFKTSSGIYPEHIIQLCGYANMMKSPSRGALIDDSWYYDLDPLKVEELWLLHLHKERGTFTAHNLTNLYEIGLEAFRARLAAYYADQELRRYWK